MTKPSVETMLTGGCQCGALRYRLRTWPKRASICFCRMCQKASGNPFMTFASVPLADLEWTHGTLATFASSNLAERGFCKACGTPLTYRFTEGSTISVTFGSLDEPNAVEPSTRYNAEGEPDWCRNIDALPAKTFDFTTDERFSKRFVSHQHSDEDGGRRS